MQHAIPLMLEHGGGAIVNTASMAGVHGGLGLSAYGGAKSGVIGLTRYVATWAWKASHPLQRGGAGPYRDTASCQRADTGKCARRV